MNIVRTLHSDNRRRAALGAVALAAVTVLAACTGPEPAGSTIDPSASASGSAVGSLPETASTIMAKPAYRAARWTYQVSDLETGEVLLANRSNELAFTASSAKLFTVAALYELVGADTRLTTPVYAIGKTNDGVLHGNLALVGAGDLALGGRNADAGRVDSSFTASTIDHVYGDIAPNAVAPPGNPVAGLDELAAQVADSGIRRVAGDVVIDDRLWEPFAGQEGTVTPIFVNDNLLDITVTPTTEGKPATVSASPETSAFQIESTVRTEPGSAVALSVAVDPNDPHRLLLTGSIGAAAGPRLTVYRIADPIAWARTLFIEALARAGVTVTAATGAADNHPAELPAKDSYRPDQRVAALESPPLSAFGTMILLTSYNTGANTLLCLIAAHHGATDCSDGLGPMRTVIEKAGLDSDQVVLIDGQGADPASVTPAQMVNWLRWTQTRPWHDKFNAGLPVLGERGSLSASGIDSPAKGKVAAKTATSVHPDPATGRILFNVQALAGFITTDDGRTLAFHLSMSGGVFPDMATGLVQAGDDVAAVAAAFQQALST